MAALSVCSGLFFPLLFFLNPRRKNIDQTGICFLRVRQRWEGGRGSAGTWPALFFSAPHLSPAAVHSRCRACCCAVSTVTQSSLPNILPPPQPSLEKVTSFKFSRRHLNHGVVAGRPKPRATTTPKAAQTKEPLQRNLLRTKNLSARMCLSQRGVFSAEQSPRRKPGSKTAQ